MRDYLGERLATQPDPVLVALIHVRQRSGDREAVAYFERALALLAAVYGRFTEGFDTRDLQDAQALLDSL